MFVTRKHLLIGLCASVSLNLGLAGLIAGSFYFGHPQLLGKKLISQLEEVIPASDVPEVKAAFKNHRLELLNNFRDFKQARAKIRELAATSPLPQDELEQALAHLRSVTLEAQVEIHQIMLEGLAKADRTKN